MIEKMQRIAPNYKKYFYIAYDISGAPEATFHEKIVSDWNVLCQKFNLGGNEFYAKQGGKPVVMVWGFGYKDRVGNPQQLKYLIDFFKSKNVYLILGTPYSSFGFVNYRFSCKRSFERALLKRKLYWS